jgi:pimeloyl-ACP methyl ester carboxylesterase
MNRKTETTTEESDMTTIQTQDTIYVHRPEGRIGYDVAGKGPLVVLVPGMGDLRGAYRFLAPQLLEADYKVVCTDLRGHGDSDATFSSYGDIETAGDVIALIDELGGPAVIVGNSMSAGSAAFVAATRPDIVRGLVLLGPFLRNPKMSALQRVLLRLAMARPWVATSWNAYMPKLYAGKKPADFADYRGAVVASLHKPGHAKAFSLTTRTDHAPVEARLGEVSVPALIVMGERDPDFPDPRAEAEWIAQILHAEVVMVPEAGHYPQSQRPEVTTGAVVGFLKTLEPCADDRPRSTPSV